MTDIRLFSHDDDEVARGLRSLYAAPAGDAYWNEQTLTDVAARYPGMDMTPYRAALPPRR